MAYSAEVIKRARKRLAQAKSDWESENRQHLADAYNRVPRLQEIDRSLRQSIAKAAQAAFISGEDAKQALEHARQKNLELQRERERLIKLYFEEGYLDDAPICDKCGGSGYLGASMCECLRELCRQEQRKELTFLSAETENFDSFRLDYYPDRIDPSNGLNIRSVMERTFQSCRRYAHAFSTKSKNLLFSGDTGLGKTFLSACIARTVADSGFFVVYESAVHLIEKLERAKFSGDEESHREAEKYTNCDLLIIDDLGTEMYGQFATSALYTLINDRILFCKPTIISTNLTKEELGKRYSSQIVSRLRGNYERVPFVGDDIRVMKNRRM